MGGENQVRADILDLVRDVNGFDGSATGFVGSKSSNYLAAEKLWDSASITELSNLAISHPSAAVRCYAVEGLCRHGTSNNEAVSALSSIKTKIFSDESMV